MGRTTAPKMRPGYLFSRSEISPVLEGHRRHLKEEASQLSASYIEQFSDQDLIRELAARYKLELPVIEEEKGYLSHAEVDIDVSHDPMRMIFDRSRPFYLRGLEITYHLPFRGEPDFFQIQPSTSNTSRPAADVSANELLLKYQTIDNNLEAVKTAYKRDLDQIKAHLGWLQEDIAKFNSTVGQEIQTVVLQRKQKLASNSALIEGLGMPVKQKIEAEGPKSRREAASTEKSIRSVKKWDVFISHASEDKEELARPLAEALRNKGVSVWYDEFSLKMGDSLRYAIDYGLANSRFGVVIFSHNFFAKDWPIKELNGLASLEVHGRKVILPIWHRISLDEIQKYSPMLADRLAISSEDGLQKLVGEILNVLDEK